MITDSLLRVSTAQTVAITDTAAVSADKIDLQVARDMGEGRPLYMVFTLPTAITGGTTTTFEVIVASDAALTTAIASLGSTGPIATTSLVQYAQFAVQFSPLLASKGQRYLGARYTVVGANNAGTVTADIVLDIQDGKKYHSSGFSVT